MKMEQLKQMKEALMSCVQGEIYNLKEADTQELGAAVDMIKDLSEAIYYCTITEAMEEKDERKESKYYPIPMYYDNPMEYNMNRDMDRTNGKMYYSGNGSSSSNGNMGSNGGSRQYTGREYPYPLEFRDRREGRSPMSRKMYMEAKEMHHGKEVQMKELENYMQELTSDMAEMIKDASPEEKQLLQKKISALAAKIEQVNV
jgi:hypothetical protein